MVVVPTLEQAPVDNLTKNTQGEVHGLDAATHVILISLTCQLRGPGNVVRVYSVHTVELDL